MLRNYSWAKKKARVIQKRRFKDIQHFGAHSSAYSTLQGTIEEFRDSKFKGFIGYSSLWGFDYVLSDPICDFKDYALATRLFFKKHPKTIFTQITQDYADILQGMGYAVYGFGVEHFVNLKRNEFSHVEKRRQGPEVKRFSRKQYGEEQQRQEDPSRKSSEKWSASKQKENEAILLARPYVNAYEKDVRFFVLVKANETEGYAAFDPVYKDGQVESYMMHRLRISTEASRQAGDNLLINALKYFKQEGFEEISLGVTPFYEREHLGKRNALFERLIDFMSRTSSLDHFKALGEYKDKYSARKVQTYIAAPAKTPVKSLFGVLKVNNLVSNTEN